METQPAPGILTSFEKLGTPSSQPTKPRGNGMMNRKSNFRQVEPQSKQPALTAREIQLYIRGKNPKRGGTNETA